MIFPDASVENAKSVDAILFVVFDIVYTPSIKLNAIGITDSRLRLSPSGFVNVIVAVTLSVPVYGGENVVKSLPV